MRQPPTAAGRTPLDTNPAALPFAAMQHLKLVRRFAVLAALLVLAAACSGSSSPFPDDAFALQASSDIGVGQGRVLIGIGDATGARLGAPDEPITIEVHPENDPGAVQTAEGEWTWIVPNATGLYRATFEFDRSGIWVANVTPAGGDPLPPVLFSVVDNPMAPALGEPAPAAPTPTLSTHSLEELTTDPDPDPSFYELSLVEALGNGRPTVVVFSTPAYCQTAACGPLLDEVKRLAPDYPGVNFLHVEVFTGLTDPDFAPDASHLAPAVGLDWYALPSEPWVFAIDEDGIVIGRFEGVMDPSELEAVLP